MPHITMVSTIGMSKPTRHMRQTTMIPNWLRLNSPIVSSLTATAFSEWIPPTNTAPESNPIHRAMSFSSLTIDSIFSIDVAMIMECLHKR